MCLAKASTAAKIEMEHESAAMGISVVAVVVVAVVVVAAADDCNLCHHSISTIMMFLLYGVSHSASDGSGGGSRGRGGSGL